MTFKFSYKCLLFSILFKNILLETLITFARIEEIP